ncbi:MAG: GntR family transcriptional regulator [Aggregatilineales bacterium]
MSTRADAVAATLRAAILDGEYLSGERLVEIALAKQLSVSQNTVREALYRLEQEGWVVRRRRHGVFVRMFSSIDVIELFALIRAVEEVAVLAVTKRAARTIDPPLSKALEQACRHAEAGQRGAAIAALFEFHEHVGALSMLPLTADLLKGLYNRVRLIEALRQSRVPVHSDELNNFIALHAALRAALLSGDPAASLEALRTLVDSYEHALYGALRQVS